MELKKQVKKEYIGWDQIDLMMDTIEMIYGLKHPVEMIVGISRGGLIPATILSHRLGVPMIELCWQTRDGDAQDLETLETIKKAFNIDTTLFVDDICDSGKTINQIKKFIPSSRWLTLITKTTDVEYAPIRLEENVHDRWIVFPWEKTKAKREKK